MKVALIGAGAVGAYIIKGFLDSKKEDVTFTVIAEGDRKKRLQDNGIKINGQMYYPDVKTANEAGAQDMVVVATKLTALLDVEKTVKLLVKDDTVVMSLMNGAESEDVLIKAVGKEHVLYSVIYIASRRFEDRIEYDATYNTTIHYGAHDTDNGPQMEEMVKRAFSGSGINAVKSDDILFAVWKKYAMNIVNNLPQAVISAPAAMYTRSEHGLFLSNHLWQEVIKIAKIEGVNLPSETGIYECADSSRYSTLQDIDNKRHTEVDSLCGYLIKIAKENSIEVPFIEYTYHAIKAIEEKNDGKFD